MRKRMLRRSAAALVIGIAAALLSGMASSSKEMSAAQITIDYPADESIFPPEFTPPTFIWRDASEQTASWRIDVTFADGSSAIHAQSHGEPDLQGSRRSADLLPRRTPDALGNGKGNHQTAGYERNSAHSVAGARRRGATEPGSSHRHAHLCQLPLILTRWQDHGHGYGWPRER